MLKTFALLVRRPDITDEQFHTHWSTVHKDHALKISTIQRYVQFHVTEHTVPGFPGSEVDGIPENWWPDMTAVTGLGDNPEYTEHAGPDELNFIDVDKKGRVVTSERIRIEAPDFVENQPKVKAILLLARSDDVAPEELERWADGDWAARVAGLPGIVRHVDALAERGPGAPRSDYDLVTQLWWPHREAYDGAKDALEALAASLAGSPVDLSRSAAVLGEELRVIWPGR